jgi:hypothetical protein
MKKEIKTYITQDMAKPHKEFFCQECGSELIETLIGAEHYYWECEAGKMYPYRKYSQETGRRQYVYSYRCPNKRRFNAHDDFMEEKIITFPNQSNKKSF